MKFIRDLLLGIVKSILIAVILSVVALSFLQKKFPPSLADATSIIDSANKMIQMNASLSSDTKDTNAIFDKENLITNRQKILDEMEKLDTMIKAGSDQVDPKIIKDTSKRDLTMMRIRLEQSEYKIRLLEYEMKQLKDEYKKIKR